MNISPKITRDRRLFGPARPRAALPDQRILISEEPRLDQLMSAAGFPSPEPPGKAQARTAPFGTADPAAPDLQITAGSQNYDYNPEDVGIQDANMMGRSCRSLIRFPNCDTPSIARQGGAVSAPLGLPVTVGSRSLGWERRRPLITRLGQTTVSNLRHPPGPVISGPCT